MADVVRTARTVEEVTYWAGPDTVRRAILIFLHDEHGAAFSPDSTLEFAADGGVKIVTQFASADTRPQGGDSAQTEAPFTSGAVPQGDATGRSA